MKRLKPILITGVYRSGTTLLSRILNNHSKLSITYDNVHFMRFCYEQFSPVSNPSNLEKLLINIKQRVEKRMEINWDISPVSESILKYPQINYACVYNEVMRSLIQESEEHQWGEKTMICWSKTPDFISMFPNGKVLHIIRDTRDVLASFKKVTNEPGLRYFDAIFTTIHSMNWALTFGADLPSKNYMCLKYEDLVREPEKMVKQISDFLEVPYEAQMLDVKKFTHRTQKEKWSSNTAYKEKLNNINGKSVGKFRQHLSNIELFLAELIARDMLTRFGYDLTGTSLMFDEWQELYQILSDDFISKRFKTWLRTNDGVEDYPSPPPEIYRKKGLSVIQ